MSDPSDPAEMDMGVSQCKTVQFQVIREDHVDEHRSPLSASTILASVPLPELSVSNLAKESRGDWEFEAECNKCALLEGVIEPIDELRFLLRGIQYPRAIMDEQFIVWLSSMEEKRARKMQITRGTAHLSYAEWLHTLHADRIDESDQYDLGAWRHALFRDWDLHQSAIEKGGVKYEIRGGVDCLIATAFELRYEAQHLYRANRSLSLLEAPWTATADVVTSMRLPADWAEFLLFLPNSYVFASGARSYAVSTFVCEYQASNVVAASQQLAFCLCSGQHQRRALGFDDGYLFGATCVGRNFEVYASKWLEDRVFITPTGITYTLNSYQWFLKLYIFLCKLADHLADEVNRMFDKWNDPAGKQEIQTKNRNFANSQKPWRMRKTRSASPTVTNKKIQGSITRRVGSPLKNVLMTGGS